MPGRPGARRLVLTLERPRELTIVFRGPGDTCRVAGVLRIHGRRGRNVVPLDGRVRGRRLDAGVFRVDVLDTTARRARPLGRLAVELRYDTRGRPSVRQVPLGTRSCLAGAFVAASLPVVGERASSPSAPDADAAGVADGDRDRSGRDGAGRDGEGAAAGSGGGEDGGVGGLAALPSLGDDAVGGVTAWIVLGLLAASAGGFLALAGTAARRALRR